MPGYNNYNMYGGQRQPISSNDNVWRGPYIPTYPTAPQQSSDGRVYVNGRAGADAYPLPMGVNQIILWDTESPRFFVKGYDNNGMPRVLEDNDYSSHVEPEPVQSQSPDMSNYATKDDIKAMIRDAFSNATIPSMVGYVTKDEMNKAFSEPFL